MSNRKTGEPPASPRAAYLALVADEDAEALLFCDGFDACITGLVAQFGQPPRVCYDLAAMEAQLVAEGLDPDEAREYLDFNVLGAYVGPYTPVFLFRPLEIDARSV